LSEAALVTGAASGIGRAVAQRLIDDGWQVLSVDLSPDEDGPGELLAADLTTREANRAAVDAALERFGRLDAVVANAGFQHVSPVESFDEDRWDALLALLLTSPFLLARYAWGALRASGNGRFVVVASVHGLVASPFKVGYISAKHGLIGLTRTAALEGGEHGITVNAICPAYVRTPLVDSQIADQAKANKLSPEQVIETIMLAPAAVKRLIEPREVADFAAYLCGEAAGTITGAALTMDLGWTAR